MLTHRIIKLIIKLMKYKNNYRKHQKERCFPPHIDKMATTRKPRLAKYYQQSESGPKLLYKRHY